MINFPNNPSINDEFTSSGKTWKWDGTVWQLISTNPNPEFADTQITPLAVEATYTPTVWTYLV